MFLILSVMDWILILSYCMIKIKILQCHLILSFNECFHYEYYNNIQYIPSAMSQTVFLKRMEVLKVFFFCLVSSKIFAEIIIILFAFSQSSNTEEKHDKKY